MVVVLDDVDVVVVVGSIKEVVTQETTCAAESIISLVTSMLTNIVALVYRCWNNTRTNI